MRQWKLRTGRLELGVLLGGPVVVLCLVLGPWMLYARSAGQAIERRSERLIQCEAVERCVQRAEGVLAVHHLSNGGKERAVEINQKVNKVAGDEGLVVKSANVEKLTPEGMAWCADFKTDVRAEGPMPAWIRSLDVWERGAPGLSAIQGRWRLSALLPEPRYEGELKLATRSLVKGGIGKPVLDARDRAAVLRACSRLDVQVSAMQDGLGRRWPSLDLRRLRGRIPMVRPERDPEAPEAEPDFRLNGVAMDGRKPLAMTDRGVVGVGDVLGGFTVMTVGVDFIEVRSARGTMYRVPLYRNGKAP